MALGTEVERGDFTTGTSCRDGPPGPGCRPARPSANTASPPNGARRQKTALGGEQILTRLIHTDGRFASCHSLKRESFPVVARDESKQSDDRPRRRRFTQKVTHVPRQIIEFFRCWQREVWESAPIFARLGE